jgi:hypothetical protein
MQCLMPLYLSLLMISVYMQQTEEGYVLRKLQRDVCAIQMWHECWNMKIKR